MLGLLLAFGVAACAGARTVATSRVATSAAPTSGPLSSAEVAGDQFLAGLASFAPVDLSGAGNRSEPWTLAPGVPALMSVEYTGTADLRITSLRADGSQQDLLVVAPGPYSGASVVGLRATPAALRVDAMGPWTIHLRPLVDARTRNVQGTLSGTGDDVAILSPPPAGAVPVIVRDSSPDTFTLTASTPGADALLVDNAGGFDGTVRVPAGAVLLDVHSSGPWSVTAHP